MNVLQDLHPALNLSNDNGVLEFIFWMALLPMSQDPSLDGKRLVVAKPTIRAEGGDGEEGRDILVVGHCSQLLILYVVTAESSKRPKKATTSTLLQPRYKAKFLKDVETILECTKNGKMSTLLEIQGILTLFSLTFGTGPQWLVRQTK